MFSENSSLSTDTNSNDDTQVAESDTSAPLQSSLMFQQQFKPSLQHQTPYKTDAELNKAQQKQSHRQSKTYDINHYARGLMQDLVANLQYVNATTPVAVVSFVMLDSDYNVANLLGIQLAESLIHEVHKFGIPVIDFKTTGFIRVTEQGDFAFSKDYEDFSGEMPARYIVGGTMLKNAEGYLINARIVGVKSQAVVASAQSFIPNSVSDPILMMSAAPKSSSFSETVELGSVTSPLDNIAKSSSSKKVSLIQE
jgi:TolB-like protein